VQEVDSVLDYVLSGGRPAVTFNINDKFTMLMRQCWSSDPEERPPFSEIVEHLTRLQSVVGVFVRPAAIMNPGVGSAGRNWIGDAAADTAC
jgi:hypothetical protein